MKFSGLSFLASYFAVLSCCVHYNSHVMGRDFKTFSYVHINASHFQ